MKKSKVLWIISIISIAIGVIGLCLYILPPLFSGEIKPIVSNPDPVVSQNGNKAELPDNPIDFAALQAQNPDVYAWIKVPGTRVDYPILQADTEPEDFYLKHNINKKYEFAGCIYTQKFNKKDFTDPNTIVYGHNMDNGSMFASLHKFREAKFFNENKYIYVYTPGHILTYTIYSAYRYDNRHLLLAFDFNDKKVFSDYIEMTKKPKSTVVNVRKDINVTENDRIITLSTCITNDNYRYLVQGVLTNDQPTK